MIGSFNGRAGINVWKFYDGEWTWKKEIQEKIIHQSSMNHLGRRVETCVCSLLKMQMLLFDAWLSKYWFWDQPRIQPYLSIVSKIVLSCCFVYIGYHLGCLMCDVVCQQSRKKLHGYNSEPKWTPMDVSQQERQWFHHLSMADKRNSLFSCKYVLAGIRWGSNFDRSRSWRTRAMASGGVFPSRSKY